MHISPFRRLYQLDALYHHAPFGLCFVDARRCCVSANGQFAVMWEKPLADLLCHDVRHIFPADAAQIADAVDSLLNQEPESATQLSMTIDHRHYRCVVQRVIDSAGDVLGVSIIVLDVSGQKRAESIVAKSEEHFRGCLELQPEIPWAASSDGTLTYIGPTFGDRNNLSMSERIEEWYALMQPDDRARVRSEWLAWLSTGQPFEARFRVRWIDQTWRWVHSQARPERAASGEIVRWFGLMRFADAGYDLIVDAVSEASSVIG
jgi:PAS domain-containing protein